MDPLHAIAAHQVSPARKTSAEEIDAFYDDNAFETLQTARRALKQFSPLLRCMSGGLRSGLQQSPEIASPPRRA